MTAKQTNPVCLKKDSRSQIIRSGWLLALNFDALATAMTSTADEGPILTATMSAMQSREKNISVREPKSAMLARIFLVYFFRRRNCRQ